MTGRIARTYARVMGLGAPSFWGLVVTVLAAASFLLADGLQRFARIGLVSRRNIEMSPTPYGHRFRSWESFVRERSMRGRWFMLIRVTGSGEATCRDILAAHPEELQSDSVAVLAMAVDESVDIPPTLVGCTVSPSRSPIPVQALVVPSRRLGPLAERILPQGFALLDDSFRVAYAARDLSRIRNVPGILALFSEPATQATSPLRVQ